MPRDQDILEQAVRAVSEQAANADALVDEALAANLDGSHPVTLSAKMIRHELLQVKADLERELGHLVLEKPDTVMSRGPSTPSRGEERNGSEMAGTSPRAYQSPEPDRARSRPVLRTYPLHAMETEWYIGTMSDDGSVLDLAVPITQAEHEALREAEKAIREAMGGMLFRLVFANHRALHDVETRMLEQLTRSDRQGFMWVPEEGIQLTLALANWLTSVRWLLDHTVARLHDEPEARKRVQEAMSREFDGHFAYRFTYKLRDFITHCDLPPISMHVSSRMVDREREDSLNLELSPQMLLAAWDSWRSHVTKDLEARTEPIDLIPLVDEAMECVERVMLAILGEDLPRFLDASRRIVDAVDRIPDDALEEGAGPMLFLAEVDAGMVRTLSPTPLPVAEARDILKQPVMHPGIGAD